MIRVRPRRNFDRAALVEITPMIDVVFLLIIFFMTTARFAQDSRAQLELPREQGEQAEDREEAGLIVNIDHEGRIIVNQDVLTLEALDIVINATIDIAAGGDAQQARILVRADRRAPASELNAVVKRLQKLGVGAARIATEVPR